MTGKDAQRENEAVELQDLRHENGQLRRKVANLESQLAEVESLSHDFATRYSQISDENENLANLYVASRRLHSTLEPSEVAQIIGEILVELVGAEEFAVLVKDARSRALGPVCAFGAATDAISVIEKPGMLGDAVRAGRAAYNESSIPDLPLAVVPLQIKGEGVGALVITRLLHGRTRLPDVSKQLLGLLARQAATALVCARLYSDAGRREA
jgi:nitrate/nitrite-specific signal transduction histidine kinase